MRAADSYYEDEWELTQEQKDAILENYKAAMRGEVVDALAAIEDVRRRNL